MIKRFVCAALLLALTLPLHADFRAIARAIDRQPGVKKIWTPGVGLARFFVWIIRPQGVRDFQVAVFEGTDDIDPRHFHQMMKSNIEPGFTPLVQVRSKKAGDSTFVYARPRPNSDRMELMVLVCDGSDTVLVRLDVNVDDINLHEPKSIARAALRH